MRKLVLSGAVTLAMALNQMAWGQQPDVQAIGPWRVGSLTNKFDNFTIKVATNVEDHAFGYFVLGFRCQDGKYDTVLTTTNNHHIFVKDSIYSVVFRYVDSDERSETKAHAFIDSGLFLFKPIAIGELFKHSEILIRVKSDNGDSYDSDFMLTDAKRALTNYVRACLPNYK